MQLHACVSTVYSMCIYICVLAIPLHISKFEIKLIVIFQGYDMEDAMILNKASFERGFAHASVYKCEVCITCCSVSSYVIIIIIIM